MQTIARMQPAFAPRSGRDLFWFRLEGRALIWVYMLNGQNPLASVWWDTDEWHYSIPYQDRKGTSKYQDSAFAKVESYLAEDDELG